MPKLHQINALVAGKKSEVEKAVSETYKIIQKEGLFDGRYRSYQPRDAENGENLPPEQQKVQFRVSDVVADAKAKWTELWDLVTTQDKGNTDASSNVTVDENVILSDVPVTSLLFLEKQLNDIVTFLSKLPTPDQSEEWSEDANSNLLKSKSTQTIRTKKVPRNHVLAEATKEHPAQVQVYHEDIPVGTWTQILYSGRVPAAKKAEWVNRAKKLQDAVKIAREDANSNDTTMQKVGDSIFEYILGK